MQSLVGQLLPSHTANYGSGARIGGGQAAALFSCPALSEHLPGNQA